MKKIKNIFILALSLSVISSCDLNLQQDPNELFPDQASVDFVLNSILVASSIFNWEGSQLAANLAQNTDIGGIRGNTFIAMYQGQDADNLNELAYASILNDAQILVPLATEREFFIHAGIAQIFQAYVIVTMSDLFGDIPWSQALDPNNLEPGPDTSREIYDAADALLLAAIDNLGQGGPIPTNDVFYAGDAASWISVAKSLRFRNHINLAQVDPTGATTVLNALIADADLLDDNGLDFAFPHSNIGANPDSRNKYFINNYVTGASDYQANHMMWAMYVEKNNIDPRIRYYFYRQVLEPTTDVNELNCINAPRPAHYPANQPFCDLEDGYWGRDMHDINGIPPDNLLRTNFGVYPAGGRFDDETAAAVLPGDGLQGAGIRPYLMSHDIAFLKAEAALTLGTTGDARTLFDAAVRASFATVRNFTMGSAEAATVTAYEIANGVVFQDDVDNYMVEVLNRWDAANAAGRADILQQEFQIATFGNGHEAYAAYRRTGLPNRSYMQPSLSPTPGDYMTLLLYPDNMASRNASITQRTVTTDRPFWVTVDQSMFFQ